MTSMQVSALENEARTWYSAKLQTEGKIAGYLKEYGEHWLTKTALAVAFIFFSKSLLEFVNDSGKPDDDEDDDD